MSEEEVKKKPTSTSETFVVNTWAGPVALLIFVFWWVAGMVIAKGFWSTTISIVFFPWALYLVVERILQMWGVV